MQLRADGLAAHLAAARASRLAPVYVIASGEPLLQIEASDAIRAAAREAGYSEREVLTVAGRFKWDAFDAAYSSLSLFAERKLIELRIATGKPGRDGSQALQTLAQRAAQADEATLTLITLPRADAEMKQAKWFTALQQAAVCISIEPVERAALPAWIAKRLGDQGQRAPHEALAFIADRVEGNLLAAHQEVKKLGLLYPQRELTLDEIQQAVLDVARYDVFKLSEALLAGDAARFVRMLEGLRGEGEAMPLVLWAISEELRTLLRVKQATEQGQSMATAVKALRVWGTRERLLPNAVARLSSGRLAQAISTCATLDKVAKGLTREAGKKNLTGDVWADLAGLGVRLCEGR